MDYIQQVQFDNTSTSVMTLQTLHSVLANRKNELIHGVYQVGRVLLLREDQWVFDVLDERLAD